MNKTIDKAIKICGSQSVLAEKCGVSQNAVSLWLRGYGINAKYLLKIEQATNGQVTVADIVASVSE
ncbi:Uncharacterized protein conserved in bacteria, prophage-related [Phocoenobacter uteri]|uniref:Uncharacterized protein conserved in bacteria, prophage-related n=1 Tax=Phocoenobacter uteri TaxID=146806 RepID=A0A379C9N6_9PAST|nr:YdaS family helix-turn-helix protein [Phocoenobacter uteri]MDG6881071.1 antirepressor [Phocoenobacter uteri]SUB59092.1 Uncharacterized protein conserved in bacteria, prophage-related [Phocoenobacter uteri]